MIASTLFALFPGLTSQAQELPKRQLSMPKKTLKRFIPSPAKLRQIKSLEILGEWIYQPNLWHINRASASTAFFVGLFMAFMPIPIQMICAALLAIWLGCNLPLSISLVWISNPLTMAPLFYFAYKVGSVFMGVPPQPLEFALSWEWITTGLIAVWQPFLLGCFVCGFFFGSLGYFTSQGLWRWQAVQRWEARHERRRLALEKTTHDVELRQEAISQHDEPDTEPPGSTTAPPPR